MKKDYKFVMNAKKIPTRRSPSPNKFFREKYNVLLMRSSSILHSQFTNFQFLKPAPLVIFIFLLACANEPTNDPSDDTPTDKTENTNEEEASISKNFNISKAIQPQIVRLKENINGQQLDYQLSFFADTLRPLQGGIYSLPKIKFRDIQLSNQSKDLSKLPKDFLAKFEKAILCHFNHSYPKWEDILIRADLNFDGQDDLYFVNEACFTENTNYWVYLYDLPSKSFKQEKQLERLNWSRMELQEDKKQFILYHQLNPRTELQWTYHYNKKNKLVKVKEVTTE